MISRALRIEFVSQSAGLIVAQGIGMVLSFALTILIARGLGAGLYGEFRYALTFLTLGMIVLQFGLPYSIARLLAAQTDRYAEQAIVGAGVLLVGLATVVGIALTMALVILGNQLGYPLPVILCWVAPALCVTIGQSMISGICQGLGRIWPLAVMQVLPYLILLPLTAIQIYLISSYSLGAAILSYVAAFSIVIAVVFALIGTRFVSPRSSLKAIISENKETGFPIYIGGLFAVASAQVITMWVADASSPAAYGHYALAVGISAPLGVLVSSIGTVIFRSSARSRKFSGRLWLFCGTTIVSLGAIFFAATELLVVPAFGSEFAPSVRMAQWLGCASLMVGWGDIFQRFLGAHGLGKRLGIAATVAGIVGIATASYLMNDWTINAAIASSLATALVYLSSMIALYTLFVREHRRDQSSAPLAGKEAE